MRRLFPVLLFAIITTTACRSAEVDLNRLHLPPGFHISIFAETGAHPRLMAFSPGGVLLATSQSDGLVLAFPDPLHTGKAQRVVKVLEDLDVPHGIAFHNGKLYIAETNRVVRYDWDEASLKATNPQPILETPRSGMHSTRTIVFANGKLYVSIGSSENVTPEKDPRRASVMEFNEDGAGGHVFARGLRNAVGLAYNEKTGTVWAGDNGRDWLGDNLPPEEINDLGKTGGDFGWPYCYGDRVIDPANAAEGARRCPSTIPPKVKYQAHSAPLGIAFYYGSQFPAEYRNSLFVAFHGSWNRSVPTGYKVVRIPLPDGSTPGTPQDFITGWLKPGETKKGEWMGRPVGIAFDSQGSMYVTDDASGPIYKITYGK
ncbi:MAG TPA: PQQ-dependent sugar dehydrogenase [Terriglobales bacterium]|nr:PQQ-dependent sugar dehydrogenase [Terriglobales bacterium]